MASALERAARAAFVSYAERAYPDGPEGDYEEVWEMGSEGFIDAARAVLMAVREPDEAARWRMAEALTGETIHDTHFTAMIDAILNEKDTTND